MTDAERPTPEVELRLRLRVAELEQGIEEAWEQVAAQATVVESVQRSRRRRAAGLVGRARRSVRSDVRAAAERLAPAAGQVRIPLAGLHAATASGGAPRWRAEVRIDGVVLPGLLADPPDTVTYRVIPAPGMRLRAFVALRQAAWLRNRGGVRFTIAVLDGSGAVVRSTARHVDPQADSEHRRWLELALDLTGLPADEHRIVLRTEVPESVSHAYAWAVWGDPVLLGGPPVGPRRAGLVTAVAHEAWAALGQRSGRGARDDADELPGGPPDHPRISLLVPVHDPDPDLLDALLHSVRTQTSPHWQLCLCDDGSQDPQVRARLRDAARADSRIVVVRHDVAQNISAATNAAFALADGAYVAPLDHDDVLHPDAIADVGAALVADPTVDMVYTDNDKVLTDGRRLAPSLKPDWSPELMRALMYTLHLGVYRRELVAEVGAWRSEFDGAQDHDLVLRLSERARRIAHVPRVLYHWRVHAGSAAMSTEAKPEAYERGRRAVAAHLERTGTAARAVRLDEPGRYRVVHEAPDAPVDVILPLPADLGPDAALARRTADAVRSLVGPASVTVVTSPQTRGAGEAAAAAGATVVRGEEQPWGALARTGLAATAAPFVVLLEEVCVPEIDGWLAELCGLVGEPAIVAAGALVVDDAGAVVHAGVALPGGVPLPVHPGAAVAGDDVAPELTFVTNRSSVSGVVAMRRAHVLGDAGPEPRAARHALALLTLGLCARAGRVVHTPHARFRVLGPPRGAVAGLEELAGVARVRVGRHDPYYNPQLWADRAAHVVQGMPSGLGA